MLWHAQQAGYTKAVNYLPNARVGSSWRSIQDNLSNGMYAGDLALAVTVGIDLRNNPYSTYSERVVQRLLSVSAGGPTTRTKENISPNELADMIGNTLLLYGAASHRKPESLLGKEQRKELGSMMTRLGLVEAGEPFEIPY